MIESKKLERCNGCRIEKKNYNNDMKNGYVSSAVMDDMHNSLGFSKLNAKRRCFTWKMMCMYTRPEVILQTRPKVKKKIEGQV